MSDMTEKAEAFRERLEEIRADARENRRISGRRFVVWAAVFIVTLVVQNTYFGWNRVPESSAESWSDLLHIIPFVFMAGNGIAHVTLRTICGVLS